jgi:hypothetical protein
VCRKLLFACFQTLPFTRPRLRVPLRFGSLSRKGAGTPAVASPSLRIVRLSGPGLTKGIETHHIDGVPVHVDSPAKTVDDCLKFRNKIGHDVAIEALKDCLRQRKASVNEIYPTPKSAGLTMSFAPTWRRCDGALKVPSRHRQRQRFYRQLSEESVSPLAPMTLSSTIFLFLHYVCVRFIARASRLFVSITFLAPTLTLHATARSDGRAARPTVALAWAPCGEGS